MIQISDAAIDDFSYKEMLSAVVSYSAWKDGEDPEYLRSRLGHYDEWTMENIKRAFKFLLNGLEPDKMHDGRKCWHRTAEDAANCAAPMFLENKWRWHDVGIPKYEQILKSFKELEDSGAISCGRLEIDRAGKFRYGHEMSMRKAISSEPQ